LRFRCEQDVLVDALTTAGRAAGRGGSLPVLSGLRLQLEGDRLELTGSDLDLTISATVKVAGEEDGKAVLPARLALEIIRLLEPGAVELSTDGTEGRIVGGRSEFSLHLMPVEEYPQLAEPGGDSVTLDTGQFAEGLRQVVPAASSDESRPILTGVMLTAEGGGLRLVATDSYRLAVRDLPGTSVLEEGQSVLIPSRALQEVARMLSDGDDLEIVLGERDASFVVGGVRLSTRLIEGEFPSYRNLIPENHPNRVMVGRHALIEALRRVKLLAREGAPVRLTFDTDSVRLVAISQDVGQASEELDAKYEGAELTVAFNPEFLLEGLEVTAGDEIALETVDSLRPALVRSPESPDFIYLLMPVRVS
jgi:DNA polymerase III subunit beta